MRATTLLSFLIFSVCLTANLHAQEERLILTREENSEWIKSLESGNLVERLNQIKKRIEADTDVYFIATRNAHGKDKIKQGFSEKSYCRPLYLFASEGKKPVILNANPNEVSVKKIVGYLKPENISKVEVESGVRTMALYGTKASCGLISLRLRNEGDLGQLKNFVVKD